LAFFPGTYLLLTLPQIGPQRSSFPLQPSLLVFKRLGTERRLCLFGFLPGHLSKFRHLVLLSTVAGLPRRSEGAMFSVNC
jgi:hypothetical protein